MMTALGSIGHALPSLIPHFWTATLLAVAIAFVELRAIAWVPNRCMGTPFPRGVRGGPGRQRGAGRGHPDRQRLIPLFAALPSAAPVA
jgi:hypothetical protein